MIPFDAAGTFRPRAGGHELRRLAVRGAVVTVSASGVALAAQVVSTFILARLLVPADFGVVTMATTFSLLLVNCGFNGFTEAIIQSEEVDHQTVSNLFWLNSGIGVVLALIFAVAGSLLARFYGNPLVAAVCRGLAIGIAIAALSVVHLALLQRAMRFVGTSVNDVTGRTLNTILSIILALRGWGYWALVAGIVGQQLSVTLGSWLMCPWIPSLPRRTGKTGTMVRFAGKVYGQFSVAYFTRNIDNFLVGWRFNAVALGFYKKAFDLFALTASQLTAPMNNVALAALSRLHQDHDRFRRSLASSLGMVALLGMAASANLTLVGKDVVRVVLGAKWSEAGTIFEIFGPGIGAMLLGSTVSWVHLSIGKPGRLLRWGIISLAFTVSAFLVALRWGPSGIAAAWSISYWVLLLPSFWYAGRPIGFRVSMLVSAVWRYAAAALAAGLVSAAIMQRAQLWETPPSTGAALGACFAISAIFSVLYLAAVILFHGGISPLQEFAGLLRELAPSRRAAPTLEVNVVEELK